MSVALRHDNFRSPLGRNLTSLFCTSLPYDSQNTEVKKFVWKLKKVGKTSYCKFCLLTVYFILVTFWMLFIRQFENENFSKRNKNKMDLLKSSSIWDVFLRRPCPQVDLLSFWLLAPFSPWNGLQAGTLEHPTWPIDTRGLLSNC